MNMHTQLTAGRRIVVTSLTLGALLLSAGCANKGVVHNSKLDREAAEIVITLDGDMRDWPGVTAATADEHHLYTRFKVEGEIYTLQSDPNPTAILIDADANASTGYKVEPTGELSSLGVDLVVEFSPTRSDGQAGRGVVLFAISNDGTRTPLSVYDWDFSFAPTYASEWYEARISRTPNGSVPASIPQEGLLTKGEVAGAFVRYNSQGQIVAASDLFRTTAGPRCMDVARKSNLEVPPKEPGVLRVVSYNVLFSSPTKKPEPFTRIFKALDPDVILVQEWEAASNRELAEWFNTNLMREGGWDVVAAAGKVSEGKGVAIITKHPAKTVENDLHISANAAPELANDRIRFALGSIEMPKATLLAASTHLKSRGSAGSPEDMKRIAEAAAINTALREVASAQKPAFMFIGGDMNLVGSYAPLETLAAGADLDGSDLAIATPRTLGDRTSVTWSENGNEFSPGRLDYILYSDSKAGIIRSFILDTARLSEQSLMASGLEAGDSAAASDHMPVVVDFMLK